MQSVENYRSDLVQTLSGLDLSGLAKVIEVFAEARRRGRTIFVADNGGSAASASHFVCDVIKGESYLRKLKWQLRSHVDPALVFVSIWRIAIHLRDRVGQCWSYLGLVKHGDLDHEPLSCCVFPRVV